MNNKQYILILLSIAALAISSFMCIMPSFTEDVANDPDLTGTLAVIQGTQTSLALIPTATHTVETVETATLAPSPTETTMTSPEVQVGSISGQLSFPSEAIPPLRVIAFNMNSGYYYYIETVQNQGAYKIENLPTGTYQVVAYVLDGSFAGGYSQAVPCGLAVGCDDHSLVNIEVNPNQDTPNIDPGDWYAPEGAFPPDPVAPGQPNTPAPGSISGSLSYPSEMIPPLQVVAFNIQSGQYYYIITVTNQSYYTIDNLPPGVYHIVAYVLDSNFGGGYTFSVPCGLSVDCADHSLIDVQVNPGEETTGIDPGDWYAPDGFFPQKPAS
ncbi:carboxypeptidase-like regulatory domain-containing protein [Chloroflexota bacterium]